jgi:hypothetical protein
LPQDSKERKKNNKKKKKNVTAKKESYEERQNELHAKKMEKKNTRRKTPQHLVKEEVSCKTKYTDKNKKRFTNLVQFLQLAPPRLQSSIPLWSRPCTISMELFRNRSEFRSRAGTGRGREGAGAGGSPD